MARVVRIVPALGAAGVALIIIGGLTVVSSAASASPRGGAVPIELDLTADPTSATQSPAATRSPASTRTVEPTEEIATDTPVPTSTNTATSTSTATSTTTPTSTPTNPAKTHTPSPRAADDVSTGTPDDATQPAGTPGAESTVLGLQQPPAGIVLPTTGEGATSDTALGGMLAGVAMLIGGSALVLAALGSHRRRA